MPEDSKTVSCGNCGLTLQEDPNDPVDECVPCPRCGSTYRTFHVSIHDTISFKEKLSMKGRHAKGGKPFIEQVHGADLHRKSGKWMNLKRIIDRENDHYHEVVTDPETGEVIHECKEPLTEHKGHGTTKSKNKSKSKNS